jgi:hypothetical protein
MTSTTDMTHPRADARRAYELGRLKLGLRTAALAIPMLGLSVAAGGKPATTALAGAALVVLSVYFRWRGQAWGRGVLPGLIAGSLPLVLPPLLRSSGHFCMGGGCWSVCMIGCVLGGALAGMTIGIASAAEKQQRTAFLLSASLVAGLAGVLGCSIVGAAGITGMAIAVIASSLPVAAIARFRSA